MGLTGIPGDKLHRPDIVVRQATPQDIDDMLRVEKEAWPMHLQFERAHIETHLEVFPEGSICAVVDDHVVGIGTVEIIDLAWWLSLPEWTWYAATGNGFIANTHNPEGDTLYGVSLSVITEYTLRGVGEAMIRHYFNLVIKMNLRRGLVEARIPLFRGYKEARGGSVDQYVYGGKARELGFYTRLGLRVATILPNYIEDEESCNYAVLLYWDNPLRTHPRGYGA